MITGKINFSPACNNQRYLGAVVPTRLDVKTCDKQQDIKIPLWAYRSNFLSPVSFGRSLKEHQSWGASVNPLTKDVGFKMFTFPDAKAVYVEIKKYEKYDHGMSAKVFEAVESNGDSSKDTKIITHQKNSKMFPLGNKKGGIFEGRVLEKDVKPGDQYRFIIVKSDGSIEAIKDPYSNKQDNIYSWSTVMDHSEFKWSRTEEDWQKNKNPEKVSRLAGIPGKGRENLTKLGAMNIYEMHIGTISDKGTFEAAKKQIDAIKEAGFNAVEILPVENCFNVNWGYDGVDKFAPNSVYGSPEALKELVDYAHSKSMNMFLDVVPNHFGGEGNEFLDAAPFTGEKTDWGAGLNLEGKNSKHVRDYLANLCLNYLGNYHFDGLRLDSTHSMKSNISLHQIAQEVNKHYPDAVLIGEDGRSDSNITQSVDADKETFKLPESKHCSIIDEIDRTVEEQKVKNSIACGLDSRWNFAYQHLLTNSILGGVKKPSSTDDLLWIAKLNRNNVKYFKSHDTMRNDYNLPFYDEGSRLIHKSVAAQLGFFDNIKGKDTKEKVHRTAAASYELCKIIATGEIEKMSDGEFNKFLQKLHFLKRFDKAELCAAFKSTVNKHKMALGFTYTTPGTTMVFQGDEFANLDSFKFFRIMPDYEKDKKDILGGCGYEPKTAYEESKIGNIECGEEYKKTMGHIKEYTKDLNMLAKTEPALIDGRITDRDSFADEKTGLMGMHTISENGSSEIFTISNFGLNGKSQDLIDHTVEFPKGKWRLIINSNDKKYGGSAQTAQNQVIESSVNSLQRVTLESDSILIFKKVA